MKGTKRRNGFEVAKMDVAEHVMREKEKNQQKFFSFLVLE